MSVGTKADLEARARAWRTSALETSCDVINRWEHGTVFRATRYPSYYDLNLVRVEEPTPMGVDELVEFTNEVLVGLEHRMVMFDDAEDAEVLRGGFEQRGWRALRLLWMRHTGRPPEGPMASVEEVPFDAVHDLRVGWHHEDFPGIDPEAFHRQSREVALRRRARVLAALRDGVPIAFAQLEHHREDAEISEVYVRRDCRGAGLGTAVTRAGIAAADSVRDLWICADDNGRPKHLYRRLGFRGVATTMDFLRLPVGRRVAGRPEP